MKRKSAIYNIGWLLLSLFIASCSGTRLADARKQYVNGDYFSAAEAYRKIYQKSDRNERAKRGVIAYEMAENYRKINSATRAATAYANAIRYGYPDTLMYLRYAQQLHKSKQYAQAIKAYENFLKLSPNTILATNGIEGAKMAMSKPTHASRYTVKSADFLISKFSEFSPILADNDEALYFTSSRDDAMGDTISGITGLKNNDIFVSRKNRQGEWQKPKNLGTVINTEWDEGSPSVTENGDFMFFTYCPQKANAPSSAEIYVSTQNGGQWNIGKKLILSKEDSVSVFAHPAVSPSSAELYFVSDMPGGYGGKDIWRAVLVGTRVVSVRNAGPEINTPGDEMFPYVKNDSTLYFSSDGHPGYGGLDIFKATKRAGSSHWNIHRMPSPVNSSADDFGITIEKNKERGFFSSNRNDAKGRDHIYFFENPDTEMIVEGIVVDKEDKYIEKAKISVVGSDGSQTDFITKKEGTYRFKARPNVSYLFVASAEGFLNRKQSLRVGNIEKDTVMYVDFEMIPYNKPVILENIFYDFNKATLRPESKTELDELIRILNENPNVSIELSAHTDRKGTDAYNQELSLRRAQSVVYYLAAQGIHEKRMKAVGYGKSQPKSVNPSLAEKYDFLHEGDILTPEFIEKLPPEQQDVADQINRRTEFRVIDPAFGRP